MAGNPSFVFSYLPTTAKNTVTSTTNSAYDQTSNFFRSARKAFTNPRLSAEQDQLQTLQRTKQHLEDHAALKTKAGMSIGSAEKDQLKAVEKALAGLQH